MYDDDSILSDVEDGALQLRAKHSILQKDPPFRETVLSTLMKMASNSEDETYDDEVQHSDELKGFQRIFECTLKDAHSTLRQNLLKLPFNTGLHPPMAPVSGLDLFGQSTVAFPSIAAAAFACLQHQSAACSPTATSTSGVRHNDVGPALPFVQKFDVMAPSASGIHHEPRLELETAELWRRFYQLTTEMVITKSGRSVRYLSRSV
jgi:T-box